MFIYVFAFGYVLPPMPTCAHLCQCIIVQCEGLCLYAYVYVYVYVYVFVYVDVYAYVYVLHVPVEYMCIFLCALAR